MTSKTKNGLITVGEKLTPEQIDAMNRAADIMEVSAYELRRQAIAEAVMAAGIDWPDNVRRRGRPKITRDE